MTIQLIEGLQALPDITIHGITNLNRIDQRVPTVSFTYNGYKPSLVSKALSDDNIFIWDGHNYALEVVRQLGIPEDEGIVRIGIAHYTTAAEVERTLDSLEKIGK